MRTFRYCRDPLFLTCVVTYTINRWLVKPHVAATFPREHLNDLICLPFWIPIMLFLQRRLGLRRHDRPPLAFEILIPLILWSWMFELWLPGNALGRGWCTSDPWDVACYSVGAFAAACFWRWWYEVAGSGSVAGTVS